MSATSSTAATSKSKPAFLLRVLNGPKRPKATRLVPVRLGEETFATLLAYTAGAQAVSTSARRVSPGAVIAAALDAYLASAKAAKVPTEDWQDGDIIEVEAIAAE